MTDPLMPAFQGPDQAGEPPGRPNRRGARWGAGNDRTPDEVARRLAYLERIGRRCEGMNRQCVNNAATRRLTVIDVDPETGKDVSEPYEVLTCSRHQGLWTKRAEYRVLAIHQLPPRTDPVLRRPPAARGVDARQRPE
jgi:hypothetical protein